MHKQAVSRSLVQTPDFAPGKSGARSRVLPGGRKVPAVPVVRSREPVPPENDGTGANDRADRHSAPSAQDYCGYFTTRGSQPTGCVHAPCTRFSAAMGLAGGLSDRTTART